VAVVPGDHSRLPTSYVPPEEYEVTLVVERKEGVGEFYIGLVGGGKQFTVHFDAGDSAMSGIWQIDGGAAAETGVPGKFFKNGVARTILYTVRKDRVTVRADGKSFINWKATWARVNLHGALTIPEKNVVFFGARAGTFHVTKATIGAPTDK
jgi:hypothetical protein